MEFIINIKHMQSTMAQLVYHQGLEERKLFLRGLRMSKVTASTFSQVTSLAALVDVVFMMRSEYKSLLSIDATLDEIRLDIIGIAAGCLLLVI